MAYDPAVIRTAYQVATGRNVPDVVLLSLFQAGVVESNFTNTAGGDRDSVGYLQQRPSQGWTNGNNVTYATNAYLDKAVAYLKSHPGASAPQIAQGVQISAFPDRYAAADAKARELLAAQGTGSLDVAPGAPGSLEVDPAATGLIPAAAMALLERITKAFEQVGSKAKVMEGVATTATKLFLPTNLVRVAAGGLALITLGFSLFFLGREVSP